MLTDEIVGVSTRRGCAVAFAGHARLVLLQYRVRGLGLVETICARIILKVFGLKPMCLEISVCLLIVGPLCFIYTCEIFGRGV